MSPNLVAIITTAALCLIGLLYLIGGWSGGKHSGRAMVRGLGLILAPIGLYVMGVMNLLVNGVRSLNDWFLRETLDQTMWIAIGVAGTGVLLVIIGSFVPPLTRDEKRSRKEARAQKQARKLSSSPSTPPRQVTTTPAKSAPATNADDDEITRILKSRGIE